MWLIFIVAVVVLAVLMLFMIIAIRMLAGQAKDQLNRYFLKNLETYDRLADNKSREIDAMQQTLKDLTEKVAGKELRLQQMTEAAQSVSGAVGSSIASSSGYTADIAAAEYAGSVSGAAYRDPDFLDDYAYVRQKMKLDYRSIAKELISRFDYTESREARLCRSMLEKLPADHLYDIVTMRDTDQIEYLSGLFNEEEEEYLGEYTKETGQFDLLALHNYITNYVKDHESVVYLRTGNPEEFADLANDRVNVVRDMGIHEGIRISYKDTVYDYSL